MEIYQKLPRDIKIYIINEYIKNKDEMDNVITQLKMICELRKDYNIIINNTKNKNKMLVTILLSKNINYSYTFGYLFCDRCHDTYYFNRLGFGDIGIGDNKKTYDQYMYIHFVNNIKYIIYCQYCNKIDVIKNTIKIYI